MKSLFVVLFTSFFSLPSQAAFIHKVIAKVKEDVLEIHLSHSGGCPPKPHKYEFKRGFCAKTKPAKCRLVFVHINPGDTCRGMIRKVVKFPLSERISSRKNRVWSLVHENKMYPVEFEE